MGLCYYRHRIYHSQLGRFPSRDPVGYESGDENSIEYVGSCPIGYVDPYGDARSPSSRLRNTGGAKGYRDPKYDDTCCMYSRICRYWSDCSAPARPAVTEFTRVSVKRPVDPATGKRDYKNCCERARPPKEQPEHAACGPWEYRGYLPRGCEKPEKGAKPGHIGKCCVKYLAPVQRFSGCNTAPGCGDRCAANFFNYIIGSPGAGRPNDCWQECQCFYKKCLGLDKDVEKLCVSFCEGMGYHVGP